MKIKGADDRAHDLGELERLLDPADVPVATRKRIEAEIRQIQAGAKGEADAAYEIELWFGRSKNWATIHDLRIEVDGLPAQIDHLILNRLGEIWVCESKHFAEGVSVNEHGEWTRWWHRRQQGIPSPTEQNRRHIVLLPRAFGDGLVPLPRRLGLVPWKPSFRSLVLVSNSARIGRPRRRVDGLEDVIKAEQLKTRLMDEFDRTPSWKLAGVIGTEGLEKLARDLVALHRPARVDWAARFGLTQIPPTATSVPPPGAATAAAASRSSWTVKFDGPCSNCGRLLPKGTPATWNRTTRKMYCLDCATA
jgi:Nuclease-related domain